MRHLYSNLYLYFFWNSESEEEEKKAEEESKVTKGRKTRAEGMDKWGHDKFMELDQAPKTKEELVKAYG